MKTGFGIVLILLGLYTLFGCSPQQTSQATVYAADACLLGNALNAADPSLAAHNPKAAAIASKSCALAPSVV